MLKCLFRGGWVNIDRGGVERRGLGRKRPARECASWLCKWGLARSSLQGPMERGCAIQTVGQRQGGKGGGGPLKNWGGRETVLKEGSGIRVLQLGPPIH